MLFLYRGKLVLYFILFCFSRKAILKNTEVVSILSLIHNHVFVASCWPRVPNSMKEAYFCIRRTRSLGVMCRSL